MRVSFMSLVLRTIFFRIYSVIYFFSSPSRMWWFFCCNQRKERLLTVNHLWSFQSLFPLYDKVEGRTDCSWSRVTLSVMTRGRSVWFECWYWFSTSSSSDDTRLLSVLTSMSEEETSLLQVWRPLAAVWGMKSIRSRRIEFPSAWRALFGISLSTGYKSPYPQQQLFLWLVFFRKGRPSEYRRVEYYSFAVSQL